MASLFPSGIDTFTNPVYTKIDGEDVVSAAHVNDLQDAIRALQEVLAGAGLPLDMASNNFIADNSSFKAIVEALDIATGTLSADLVQHIAYVLVTDPVQHHSNVIEVTPIGNLASSRVQPALVEHQADIDSIMSGGLVEGVTLDNRYVNKSGAQSMQGPLTVTTSLLINGSTTLGDALGDTVTVVDSMTVGGALSATGIITATDDILVQVGKKVAEEGQTNASYIMFGADKLEFYSHKDFVFRLDADDAVDGNSDAGLYQIRNGLDALVLSVDESGNLVSIGDISSVNAVVSTQLSIGTTDITSSKLDMGSDELHIQLDKAGGSLVSRFFITQDGDTGANLASVDLLMNLDQDSVLTTGVHVLKSGVQETGYFGQRVISANAGGVFFGAGVNFKHQLTNSPSSVTLTPDAGSLNYSNLSVVDMNQYGFFFEYDTVAVGAAKVFGTYTTVGN
jgi:hypothetical protein